MAHTNGFPRTLLVAGRQFTVRWLNTDEWPHTQDIKGWSNWDVSRIDLLTEYGGEHGDISLDSLRESLVHEVLHMLWDASHISPLRKKLDTEEQVVAALAVGLAVTLHDNPNLTQWLQLAPVG